MNQIEKARIFAVAAHSAAGQFRKYTDEPYHTHPEEVASIVSSAGGTETQIIAALLHDVVEDTYVSIDLIEKEFGASVAELVDALTDKPKLLSQSRAEHKESIRWRYRSAPVEAKMIKIADIIANTKDVVGKDPKFAKVYLEEKRMLLNSLRGAHDDLWVIASDQVVGGIGKLHNMN